MIILLILSGSIVGINFLIILINYILHRKLSQSCVNTLNQQKLVSVLIPARNEEENIEECILSVISQDYQKLEIIICDDASEDNTQSIIKDLQISYPGIKLIINDSLPAGWNGKNYCCHLLSQKSKGDYLLFIDADVRLNPNCISNAINEMNNSQLSLLSLFPKQNMESIGEKLVVSNLYWILLAFLPLKLIKHSSNSIFTAAIGQFLLFNREAYFAIQGHAGVRNSILEDIDLAKKVKNHKLRIDAILAPEQLNCRMYEGYYQSLNGFAKQFKVMNNIMILPILVWIMIGYVWPLIAVFFDPVAYIFILALIFGQAFLILLIGHNLKISNILITPLARIQILVNLVYAKILNRYKIMWKARKI